MNIPILVYHKVDPRFEWGLTRVTPPQFKRQLAYLSEQGFRTISFRQLFSGDSLDENQKYIIISFDDAYQSVFENAFPILRQFQFTATVFVISDFVGKQNRWDVNLGGCKFSHLGWHELRQLANAGWEMGSHTLTHPDLLHCSESKLVRELEISRQTIERNTSTEVIALSYPFGRYNQRVQFAAQNAGYAGACTMQGGFAQVDQPFQVARQAVYLWDSFAEFKAKTSPSVFSQIQQLKQAVVSCCSFGTILVNKFRSNPSVSDSQTQAWEPLSFRKRQ